MLCKAGPTTTVVARRSSQNWQLVLLFWNCWIADAGQPQPAAARYSVAVRLRETETDGLVAHGHACCVMAQSPYKISRTRKCHSRRLPTRSAIGGSERCDNLTLSTSPALIAKCVRRRIHKNHRSSCLPLAAGNL